MEMTIDESIKRLQALLKCVQLSDEQKKAISNGIKALEKQIPKKINYIAIPHCSCGCVIGRTDNYCRTCGQAVKRGD